MGGRVVEGTGLENRQTFARFVGSNPTPSAKTNSPEWTGLTTRVLHAHKNQGPVRAPIYNQ